MEESELVAETLGEQVFNYFLLNKREEWEEYRSAGDARSSCAATSRCSRSRIVNPTRRLDLAAGFDDLERAKRFLARRGTAPGVDLKELRREPGQRGRPGHGAAVPGQADPARRRPR